MTRRKSTVRKNLTLEKGTVEELDAIVSVSGLTQSQVVDRAFRSCNMALLSSYALHRNYKLGILELMDEYQVHEDLEIGTSRALLETFLTMVLPVVGLHAPTFDANEYVSRHMPVWAVEESGVMRDWYERAKAGNLVTSDLTAVRAMLEDYIRDMLRQEMFLTESYMFRNIIAVCDCCCDGLGDDIEKAVFQALQSRGVFDKAVHVVTW